MIEENQNLCERPYSVNELKTKIAKLINFDRGLKRGVFFEKHIGAPIEIKNRRVFISDTLDRIKKSPDINMSFIMLDFANIRQADKAGAADLVLNRIAHGLQAVVTKFKLKYNDSNFQLDLCRYGGDEFTASLNGTYDEKIIAELKDDIKRYFSSDNFNQPMGIFKRNISEDNQAITKPIEIRLKKIDKKKDIEVIERPKKEVKNDRDIFDAILHRGSIIGKEQIEAAKQSNLPNILLIKPTEYPNGINTDVQKLRFLKARFPEIGLEIGMLTDDDYNSSAVDRKQILTFLEDRLYDRLLGAVVYSVPEFASRIHNYERIFCFDLKFIKEANDILSYFEADTLISALYKQISQALNKEVLLDQVDMARKGGTFYMGVKSIMATGEIGFLRRTSLSRFEKIFNTIKSVQASLRGKETLLLIGKSEAGKPPDEMVKRIFGFKPEILGKLENEAEDYLYDQLFKYLIDKKEKNNLENIFVNESREATSFRQNYFNNLIREFFIGKRAEERANKMFRLIQSTNDYKYKGPEYNQLRGVLQIIDEYVRKYKIQLDSQPELEFDSNELYKLIHQKIYED